MTQGRSEAGERGGHLTIVTNEVAKKICEPQEALQLFVRGRSGPVCNHTFVGSGKSCPCCTTKPKKGTVELTFLVLLVFFSSRCHGTRCTCWTLWCLPAFAYFYQYAAVLHIYWSMTHCTFRVKKKEFGENVVFQNSLTMSGFLPLFYTRHTTDMFLNKGRGEGSHGPTVTCWTGPCVRGGGRAYSFGKEVVQLSAVQAGPAVIRPPLSKGVSLVQPTCISSLPAGESADKADGVSGLESGDDRQCTNEGGSGWWDCLVASLLSEVVVHLDGQRDKRVKVVWTLMKCQSLLELAT